VMEADHWGLRPIMRVDRVAGLGLAGWVPGGASAAGRTPAHFYSGPGIWVAPRQSPTLSSA
jgi:hypothetical protein